MPIFKVGDWVECIHHTLIDGRVSKFSKIVSLETICTTLSAYPNCYYWLGLKSKYDKSPEISSGIKPNWGSGYFKLSLKPKSPLGRVMLNIKEE